MKGYIIKKLARSRRYQSLYARAKEINNICLFKNNIDFTPIQVTFLSYLEMYNQLYQDLYMKEPLISEEVIEDDLRCEAYLLWKAIEKNKPATTKPTVGNTDGSVIFRG